MDPLRPELDFQAFLAQGRFMIQRSRSTGSHVFFPRVAAPGSGCEDLEWVEACGRGVVYSVTIVRNKPPTPDYNVVLVDLEEGVRMMSRVVDVTLDDVRIGMAVQARVEPLDGTPAVVFTPAEGVDR